MTAVNPKNLVFPNIKFYDKPHWDHSMQLCEATAKYLNELGIKTFQKELDSAPTHPAPELITYDLDFKALIPPRLESIMKIRTNPFAESLEGDKKTMMTEFRIASDNKLFTYLMEFGPTNMDTHEVRGELGAALIGAGYDASVVDRLAILRKGVSHSITGVITSNRGEDKESPKPEVEYVALICNADVEGLPKAITPAKTAGKKLPTKKAKSRK